MAACHPPSRALVFVVFSTVIAIAGGGCRRHADSSIKGGEKGAAGARPDGAREGGYRRVVSLTPSLTEIVFALGAGERVVGVSDYCDYPPEVTSRPRVGTFLQPSVEKILALRPDLILVDGVQQDVAAALRAAGGGAKVVAIPMNDLEQVRAAITQVGAGLGDRQREAAALLAQFDGELAEIRRIVEGRGSRPLPKVLFVVDRQLGGLRGVVAAGPGTYLDELVRLAGGSNIFADLKVRYAKVAVEAIEERQPEVIFDTVHSDPAGRARARADWLSLRNIPAVSHGRIYVLSEREFVTPGPRLGKALRQLVRLLGEDAPPP